MNNFYKIAIVSRVSIACSVLHVSAKTWMCSVYGE